MGGTPPTVDAKKKAAHFVANLWAYIDGMNPIESYGFTFTDSTLTYTAYGLISQPVITEAFASHQGNPDGDDGTTVDWYWGYAIEVYNPSGSSFVLNLLNADGTIIGALGPIGPNTRKVFYNLDSGPDHPNNGDEAALRTLIFGVSPADWGKCPILDFSGNATIRIGRAVGSEYIPLDIIRPNELGTGYSCPSGPDPHETGVVSVVIRNSRRDKDTARYRYNVARYVKYDSDPPFHHRLGTNDGAGATDLNGNPPGEPNVYQGFNIPQKGANDVATLGELLDIYITGASREQLGGTTMAIVSFPEKLAAYYADNISRGRMELIGANGAFGATCVGNYPAVPQASILGEFFEVVPPDVNRGDELLGEHSRIYGKININTASADVLMRLPWPDEVNGIKIGDYGDTDPDDSLDRREAIVNGIIGYRQAISGFRTPGQIAALLGSHTMANLMGPLALTPENANYLDVRDELYRSIANVITVNSDVYTVYIRVQLGNQSNPRYKWNYLAVIDRSNCRTEDDTPAVLLFSQVK